MYTDFVFDLRYWLKPHKLLAVTVQLQLTATANTYDRLQSAYYDAA
jgi:hypothetical protein